MVIERIGKGDPPCVLDGKGTYGDTFAEMSREGVRVWLESSKVPSAKISELLEKELILGEDGDVLGAI